MTEPVIIGNATPDVRIYALCEWPSQEPHYIGKTIQLIHKRRAAHFRDAARGLEKPLHRWIRKRKAYGRAIAVKLLEIVPGGEAWQAREQAWIARYRSTGRLLNLTDGGEGLHGLRFSKQHRERIAAALRKGGFHNCARCGASFYRKPKDAKGRRLFCSRLCANVSNRGGHHGA